MHYIRDACLSTVSINLKSVTNGSPVFETLSLFHLARIDVDSHRVFTNTATLLARALPDCPDDAD